MATFRPVIKQCIDDRTSDAVAVPFKNGNDFGQYPTTQAEYGAYGPGDWPYRSFSIDPQSGVFLTYSPGSGGAS